MRQPVWKTYKLYIGGKFPRTESGRYEAVRDADGALVANMSRASRKDFRNAVVAARSALTGWSGGTAYLRGQILYRAAEMLEGRAAQFVDELQRLGLSRAEAQSDVERAGDLLVNYAGWTDKFQALFGSVNPVGGPHFCFSSPEPTGVVAVLTPRRIGLAPFIEAIAPVIAGGNTCVAIVPIEASVAPISFAEALHTSDLPAGVVNVLSGHRSELLPHAASHMDVNALAVWEADGDERRLAEQLGAENLKRCFFFTPAAQDEVTGNPALLMRFQETKTTWHPVGT
ncbi:MAG: aldehyde dehydrogenase family protein [Armatimonadetes bacterium]|nr:aldehyde dehydrogenase family protein [Armatimonadota bacterium]